VSAGRNHTCGIRTTGRLYCWGRDSFGALGDSQTIADRTVPTQVSGTLTTWTAPEAGSNHTCARNTDRRLACWGNDNGGQLGNGPPPLNSPIPVEVL
jgi:alpha-tubulin suppressor-like RCC1 family protein